MGRCPNEHYDQVTIKLCAAIETGYCWRCSSHTFGRLIEVGSGYQYTWYSCLLCSRRVLTKMFVHEGLLNPEEDCYYCMIRYSFYHSWLGQAYEPI